MNTKNFIVIYINYFLKRDDILLIPNIKLDIKFILINESNQINDSIDSLSHSCY